MCPNAQTCYRNLSATTNMCVDINDAGTTYQNMGISQGLLIQQFSRQGMLWQFSTSANSNHNQARLKAVTVVPAATANETTSTGLVTEFDLGPFPNPGSLHEIDTMAYPVNCTVDCRNLVLLTQQNSDTILVVEVKSKITSMQSINDQVRVISRHVVSQDAAVYTERSSTSCYPASRDETVESSTRFHTHKALFQWRTDDLSEFCGTNCTDLFVWIASEARNTVMLYTLNVSETAASMSFLFDWPIPLEEEQGVAEVYSLETGEPDSSLTCNMCTSTASPIPGVARCPDRTSNNHSCGGGALPHIVTTDKNNNIWVSLRAGGVAFGRTACLFGKIECYRRPTWRMYYPPHAGSITFYVTARGDLVYCNSINGHSIFAFNVSNSSNPRLVHTFHFPDDGSRIFPMCPVLPTAFPPYTKTQSNQGSRAGAMVALDTNLALVAVYNRKGHIKVIDPASTQSYTLEVTSNDYTFAKAALALDVCRRMDGTYRIAVMTSSQDFANSMASYSYDSISEFQVTNLRKNQTVRALRTITPSLQNVWFHRVRYIKNGRCDHLIATELLADTLLHISPFEMTRSLEQVWFNRTSDIGEDWVTTTGSYFQN